MQVANEPRAVKRLARRFRRDAEGPVVACYEAGPTGFALQRQLEAEDVACRVIAPALIPRRPGDRVKTDRRDARQLAELLRADLLTEVHPPTSEQEAVRDPCRAREDAVADRTRARHRLPKLLLPRGLAYESRHWTQRHRRWLLTLRLAHPAAQATFDDYLRALEAVEDRLPTLEAELGQQAASDAYREAVGLLRGIRVDTATALTVLAELGEVTRFGSARQLMAYLGLTPSEHSSGTRQRRGPITKTGNTHVRRLLVESAWHYRHPPRVGRALRQRCERQPGWAVALADRAQARLHRRHRQVLGGGQCRGGPQTGRLLVGGAAPRHRGACGGLMPRADLVAPAGGGDVLLQGRSGWMSEGELRRTRGTPMRQRCLAPSTRDPRRRPLPTKHGHAARPLATRGYQSDTSSPQCSRSSISSRPGARLLRPPSVRVVAIESLSLHIRCSNFT